MVDCHVFLTVIFSDGLRLLHATVRSIHETNLKLNLPREDLLSPCSARHSHSSTHSHLGAVQCNHSVLLLAAEQLYGSTRGLKVLCSRALQWQLLREERAFTCSHHPPTRPCQTAATLQWQAPKGLPLPINFNNIHN